MGVPIALGVAAIVVIVYLTRGWWRHRKSDVELGTISHHWLAEQRLGRKDDLR